MYKNNRRNSNKFGGYSPLKLCSGLTGKYTQSATAHTLDR